MDTVVNEESALVQKVDLAVPADAVREETEKRLKKFAAKVRIDGFRPGKAPMKLVRQRYLATARVEAMDALVSRTLRTTLAEERFRKAVFVHAPEFPSAPSDEGGLEFSVRVEFLPVVDEPQYQGLAVEKPRATVEESAVDAELEKARQANAELLPVEDRTTVEAEDVVVLSYVGVPGEAWAADLRADNQTVELASPALLQGFAAGIVGATVGEPRDVDLRLPEEFPDEALAGQAVTLLVTVSEIKKRFIPELDDELAATVGEADTLAAWRDAVRARLLQQKEDESERETMQNTTQALVRANPLDFPAGFLHQEALERAKRRLKEFEAQGLAPSKMGITPEMLAPRLLDPTRDELAAEVLLTAVARTEEIVIDDEAIDAFLQKVAADRGEPIAKVRARYHGEREREVLRANLLLDEALRRVRAGAEITIVDPVAPDVVDAEASVDESTDASDASDD
jgi:trigger factor